MKRLLAGVIKVAMALGMLAALVGIPYFIASEAWAFLVAMYNQHPVWFVVVLIPILYLAGKLCAWLFRLLGVAMMAVGGIVDTLEEGPNRE